MRTPPPEWATQAADDVVIAGPGEDALKITAFTARQTMSGYVGSEISYLMSAQVPALVMSGGRLVWRAPIVLTQTHKGVIGVVGILDVDATTGQLIIPDNFNANVIENAKALTQRIAVPAAD